VSVRHLKITGAESVKQSVVSRMVWCGGFVDQEVLSLDLNSKGDVVKAAKVKILNRDV